MDDDMGRLDESLDFKPLDDDKPKRFLTRRKVLGFGVGGLAGAGLLTNWLTDIDFETAANRPPRRRRRRRPTTTTSTTAAPQTTTTQPPSADPVPWSDPATWGGALPGPNDVATIDQPVLLDVDATVAGVQVGPGGQLIYDPAASRTLTSTGNVVVAGSLHARPANADVVHRLVFSGVDESRFVGAHTMEPLDTDVGLWVIEGGTLDLKGAAKRGWTNLTGAVGAGAATIAVADASGWRVGDEIVVTPTEAPGDQDEDPRYAERHDRRVVTAIQGGTVTLDRPLEFAHPAVTVRPGVTHTAEVLNLSRNVRIEGTPDGRAHVMILHGNAAQSIAHTSFRYLGPMQASPDDTELADGLVGVLGRYSLHFHMDGDGSRGSVVEGAVAYDGGNSSFVPHLSHGVTFRDCVAYNMFESAYWWDQAAEGDRDDSVPSHDVVYERCIAYLIKATEASKYGITGFLMGAGHGNVARNCVAVGVIGGEGADEATSAFVWPEHSQSDDAMWTFEDCLSHNNYATGIYWWQNNAPHTIVERYTSYYDYRGIEAGAYTNLVSYRDSTIYAGQRGGLTITAVAGRHQGSTDTITYDNIYIDQAGRTDFAVAIKSPVVELEQATRITGCQFAGGTTAQVGFPEANEFPLSFEFRDCRFSGNAFWLSDDLGDDVDIRVQDSANGSIMVLPSGEGATPRAEWNASVSSV